MSDDDQAAVEEEPATAGLFSSARFYVILALIVLLVVVALENMGRISVLILFFRIGVSVATWSLLCFLLGLVVMWLLLRGRPGRADEGE